MVKIEVELDDLSCHVFKKMLGMIPDPVLMIESREWVVELGGPRFIVFCAAFRQILRRSAALRPVGFWCYGTNMLK